MTSLLQSLKGLLDHRSDRLHTFHVSNRTSPIKGTVVGVDPRDVVVRTREGKELNIPRRSLSAKDRAFIELWLKRHPVPRVVETAPTLGLSVEKRILPASVEAGEQRGEGNLRLFFDVTVRNLTDAPYDAVSLAYTLYKESSGIRNWEAETRGELQCTLAANEEQTHRVEGSLRKPDGRYDSYIHRMVVYASVDGEILAQASDWPELLRRVHLQHANLSTSDSSPL